eukprot:364821-Chlamydomonas_euryale.AAC.10
MPCTRNLVLPEAMTALRHVRACQGRAGLTATTRLMAAVGASGRGAAGCTRGAPRQTCWHSHNAQCPQ